MGAATDDLPAIEDDDLLGAANGGDPLGDDDDRGVPGHLCQGCPQRCVGGDVQG